MPLAGFPRSGAPREEIFKNRNRFCLSALFVLHSLLVESISQETFFRIHCLGVQRQFFISNMRLALEYAPCSDSIKPDDERDLVALKRRESKAAITTTLEKRDALHGPGWSASGFNPSRPDGPSG